MDVSGKITLGGVESEFALYHDQGWQQWGAPTEALGARIDLLDKLAAVYAEWAYENLCTECEDALLPARLEHNGLCGNCADRSEDDEEG